MRSLKIKHVIDTPLHCLIFFGGGGGWYIIKEYATLNMYIHTINIDYIYILDILCVEHLCVYVDVFHARTHTHTRWR